MRARDRRAEMRALLNSRPVRVEELAERYAVSLSTIAREAERFVLPGQLVTMDAGTTVGALADRLSSYQGITVASR